MSFPSQKNEQQSKCFFWRITYPISQPLGKAKCPVANPFRRNEPDYDTNQILEQAQQVFSKKQD
jgi:hypothetical protein